MSDIAISVENLSKKYQIGRAKQRHNTLRDALVDGLQAPFQRLRRNGSYSSDDTFWALRDVSFEVQHGAVLGIVGANGAGKSTLLKILSQITEPTMGHAIVHGRVGSLLEVGTGFHPELTGRENVYLNGAILGMRRTEINRKFDEIVAFAEVDQFLDTPVKRYSSGMYVRLAFAVAAHLEPEILVVDEVLAVGDAKFQQKCLGKMADVATAGRTVLFVSHNMSAIQRLCSQAILLQQGRIVGYDSAREVVSRYVADNSRTAIPDSWIALSSCKRVGTGAAKFAAVKFSSDGCLKAGTPYVNGPVEFVLDIVSDSHREVGSLAVTFYDQLGTKLVNADTVSSNETVRLEPGHNFVRLYIHNLYLNAGIYQVGLWLAQPPGGVFDHVASALRVQVDEHAPNDKGAKPANDGVVSVNFDVTYSDHLPLILAEADEFRKAVK